MSDFDKLYNKYFKGEIDGAIEWCYNLYVKDFEDVFKDVLELYDGMDSEFRSISDSELEWIITGLPLELFAVSESLNNMKLGEQVIRLKTKELKSVPESESELSEVEFCEFEILKAIHASAINRVENQITFCKELIMGAKKVWDSRRAAEKANPVSEVALDDLPAYRVDRQPIYGAE